MAEPLLEQRIAEQLLEQTRTDGVKLVGPGGLLVGVTRRILETVLETEISEPSRVKLPTPAHPGLGQLVDQAFAEAKPLLHEYQHGA
jgi:hypothetical protein